MRGPGASPRTEGPTRIQCLFGRDHIAAASGAGTPADPGPASGAGQAMPATVQAKMERALDADFSNVRVHEGPQAQAIGALAYAQGTNIHFAPGQYDPESQRGQELLGHELTHVVQQAQGRVSAPQGKDAPINHDPALEHEADVRGAAAARGEPATGHAARGELASPPAAAHAANASASGPVQALLSVKGRNLTRFSEEIGVAAYDKALKAGDVEAVRKFEEALIRHVCHQVPYLSAFIESTTFKVTVPRGLHRNQAKNVDYEPEREIHQTLQTLGLGGAEGPNWHLIYKVDGGTISLSGWQQTNSVDCAKLLGLKGSSSKPSEPEQSISEQSTSSDGSSEETSMEVEWEPPSFIRSAYFYFKNYGIGSSVHGYIMNAKIKPTGIRSEDYYEAEVESGELPEGHQSFTMDRPFVSPINQKVWFSIK